MLDEFLPRRPYVPLVHSGSSNVSTAATEKPHDRTPIADVRSRSPPSPGKCNVRFAQMEDQNKSENVAGAHIMMTAGVGPTKQSIQRSFPGFSSDFPTPPTHKLILVVRLRKAEPGRVSARERGDQAGHHRPRSRSDFYIVSAPSNSSRIAQSQVSCDNRRWRRCGAACGPSTALIRAKTTPLVFWVIARYYNPSASHQGFARCGEDVDTAPNQAAASGWGRPPSPRATHMISFDNNASS